MCFIENNEISRYPPNLLLARPLNRLESIFPLVQFYSNPNVIYWFDSASCLTRPKALSISGIASSNVDQNELLQFATSHPPSCTNLYYNDCQFSIFFLLDCEFKLLVTRSMLIAMCLIPTMNYEIGSIFILISCFFCCAIALQFL